MTYDRAEDTVHGRRPDIASWGGWNWQEPRYGDFFRTCSFCGCINPEDLVAVTASTGCGFPDCPEPFNELAIVHFIPPVKGQCHNFVETGWRPSWADQKYGWPHKFYVEGLVPRDPALLHVLSASSALDRDALSEEAKAAGWVRAQDLTEQHIQILVADGWARDDKDLHYSSYQFKPRTTLSAKFYTTHLNDETIPAEVRETIMRVSGRRLTWLDNGRVRWEPYRENNG